MSRALRSGAPRLLGRHDGAAGRWYDEQYRALLERFGPFDAMTRSYAASVSVLWTQFQEATRGLRDSERVRAEGKGRRPSARDVERLKRRQGLTWGSYDQALRRLDEMAQQRTQATRDPLAEMRRAVDEANR